MARISLPRIEFQMINQAGDPMMSDTVLLESESCSDTYCLLQDSSLSVNTISPTSDKHLLSLSSCCPLSKTVHAPIKSGEPAYNFSGQKSCVSFADVINGLVGTRSANLVASRTDCASSMSEMITCDTLCASTSCNGEPFSKLADVVIGRHESFGEFGNVSYDRHYYVSKIVLYVEQYVGAGDHFRF